MTKKILILFLSILFASITYAQKPQRIAYIDMEYILENVPDYQEASTQLQAKVQRWQDKIAENQRGIEILKTDLANEKALLTPGLIEEREEDITIRTEELKKTQNKYFGTKGDLFRLRKQLAKPVQDQVYNAIQDIAKKRRYDFVLDKSSDLIMLYSNDKYDISDLVIKRITRNEKQRLADAKRNKGKKVKETKELSPEAAAKLEEREAKKQEIKENAEAQKAERAKQREERKKGIEEARKKKLEARAAARKKAEEKRAAAKKARAEKRKKVQEERENNNNN